MADIDGLRYSPDDPYYKLGPVDTCLYVRVRETGDWDLFRSFVPVQSESAICRIRNPVCLSDCREC